MGSTRAGINMDAVLKMARHRATPRPRPRPTASASAPASWWCSATPWRTTPSWPARSTARARPTKWSTWACRARASCAPCWPTCRRTPTSTIGGRGHQGHRVQDHPRRRAHGARGQSRRLGVAAGHPGPVAGAHARRGRLRGRDPRGHRRGHLRRPRHHGGARHAERRREEGRRHGVVVGGRAFGRVHPRVRGCRHDPRRRGRGAFAREAGGHDLRVLGGPGHDRRPRRHHAWRPSSASSRTSAPSA